MSQKQPRFSWKKPWAFQDIHEMRKYITEREVYKKLKILERHSSFKKPYWNFRSHPHGELYYVPPGFDPGYRPGGGGWIPPDGELPNRNCELACNGGILDCYNGGCDIITCICARYPVVGIIREDPTGSASLEGGSAPNNPLRVCIEGQKTNAVYAEVIVEVVDDKGQIAITEHPLVNCRECCAEFNITGASSVNPGSTWVGTIAPCCEDIKTEVTVNCGTVAASLSPDGCTVSVTVSDTSACGTFTVTATHEAEDCATRQTSIGVKINNTGQGGQWFYDQSSSELGQQGCTTCGCGGSVAQRSPPCFVGDYKYGGFGGPLACDGTATTQCKGTGGGPCAACGGASGVNPCGWASQNCGGGTDCEYWGWWRCDWNCPC